MTAIWIGAGLDPPVFLRAGQVVRTDVNSVSRQSSAARGVIVMRLNEGDEVAGIAVFRQGLAEQRAMSDNAEAGPEPDDAAPRGDDA